LKRRVILDTGFFLVYFFDLDPGTRRVMEEIYRGSLVAYITHLNLTEFFYLYSRKKGIDSARSRVSLVQNSPVKVALLDKGSALRAGEIKVRYPFLSLVDSYLVALAERERASIITTDSGIAKVYGDTSLISKGRKDGE
jgi:predicted nucleic acid-binding protein